MKTETYKKLLRYNGGFILFLLLLQISCSLKLVTLPWLMGIMVLALLIQNSITSRHLHLRMKNRDGGESKGIPETLKHYTFFIISWIFALVILPAVILSNAFFAAETSDYIRRQEVVLAHRMNERTEMFRQFYRDNIPSANGDTLCRKRNGKGLYYKSINHTIIADSCNPGRFRENQTHHFILHNARNLFDRIMNENVTTSLDPTLNHHTLKADYPEVSIGFDQLRYGKNGKVSDSCTVVTSRSAWTGIFSPVRNYSIDIAAIVFWIFILLLLIFTGVLVRKIVKMLFYSVDPEYIQPLILNPPPDPATGISPTPVYSNCKLLEHILMHEAEFNPDMKTTTAIAEAILKKRCSKENSICKETRHSAGNYCDFAETIVIAIQQASLSFFEKTWSSLSLDEKFLLYDLAQDGLINLKNRKTISSLFDKKIICWHERVEFVSAAFKNYVLTDADKTSFDQIRDAIDSEARWNEYKAPLILVVASIIVFLFFTQQNFLSNLNTILISAGALGGVYLKFSGLFPLKKS